MPDLSSAIAATAAQFPRRAAADVEPARCALFAVALAVGLLVAAWEPSRARGLLPMALALAAAMAVTALADVVSGETPAVGDAHHVLGLVGMALLWILARHQPRSTTTRSRLAG